jgi:hypothetical protein
MSFATATTTVDRILALNLGACDIDRRCGSRGVVGIEFKSLFVG